MMDEVNRILDIGRLLLPLLTEDELIELSKLLEAGIPATEVSEVQ